MTLSRDVLMMCILLENKNKISSYGQLSRRLALSSALVAVAGAGSQMMVTPAQATCNGASAPYTITAGTVGIDLDTDCAGAGGTVTVQGNITTAAAVALRDAAGGKQDWAITVNNGVTVHSLADYYIPIYMESANASIVNNGNILSEIATVIYLTAGGTVTNNSTGVITSANGTGIYISGATGQVINSGSITGQGGEGRSGVYLNNGGSVSNLSGGTITHEGTAVTIYSGGTLNNAGTLTGQGGESSAAVHFSNGGTVNNLSGGVIESTTSDAEEAIYFYSGISAGNITNAGTIRTTDTTAILFAASDDRLELQSGSVIVGEVEARDGTDTLAFGGTGTLSFDISDVDGNNTDDGEQYLNFETFVKEDASTVNFTGTNTEISTFTINGGLLNVNAQMQNTNFTLNGGKLGGTGTINGLNLTSGSTLAPGNSIGTLNVAGNLNFAAGSTYEVEVAKDGTSDLVNVTGTATLAGNVDVITIDGAADYTVGQKYTIVTATGGVTGTFASITDDSIYLNFSNTYDANNAYLNLTQVLKSSAVAQTINQKQIATAWDSLNATAGSDAATVNAELLGLNQQQALKALDATQGEVHVDGAAAAVSYGNTFLEQMLVNGAAETGLADSTPRSDQATGVIEIEPISDGNKVSNTSLWLGSFGAFSTQKGDGNASGYTSTLYGISGGVQADISEFWDTNISAGLALGYSEGQVSLDDRSQSYEADNYHIGIYALGGAGDLEEGLSAKFGAAYTHHSVQTTRNIELGNLSRTAIANYGAGTWAGDAELRYNLLLPDDVIPLPGSTFLSPLLRFQTSQTYGSAFTETGAGALNLSSAGFNATDTSIALGVSISGDYKLVTGVSWKPSLTLAYERALGHTANSGDLNLAGSSTGFSVFGPEVSRDRLRLGSTSSFAINENIIFTAGFDTLISTHRQDFSTNASFKIRF